MQCLQSRTLLLKALPDPPDRPSSTQLWPTHKVLCKRDPDVFYIPPLTARELDLVCAHKDRRLDGPGRPTFYEDITQADPQGHPGDVKPWENFVTSITSTEARPRPGFESLAEARDDRFADLTEAYRFLAVLTRPPFAHGIVVERSRAAWYFFAMRAGDARTLYLETWAAGGVDALASDPDAFARDNMWLGAGSCVVLNKLYRQLVVNMTLGTWAILHLGTPRIAPLELDALMATGEQRVLDAVDAADLMPLATRNRFRRELERYFQARQRANRSV
ncbi:hypothetical protein JCM3775_006221 [Rhodotorula graminis]